MRILVTGGAGFIGRWVVKTLLDNNYEVCILDDLSNGSFWNIIHLLEHPKLKSIKIGNIKDATVLGDLFYEGIDIIIHLAANGIIQNSIDNPRRVFENDVMGTFNLLEEARTHHSAFVFISTCMVYDSATAYGAISESHPIKAGSPYAATKIANESLVQAYHNTYGLHTVILRPFNTYGEYQKTTGEGGVIPIFIKQDISGLPITIYGDGTQTRDLMHVEDCADFIVRAAFNDNCNGEIINAGYGEDISINKLAAMICKDSFNRVRHVKHIHPQSEIQKLKCDRSKAKKMLGWEPKISLEEGIRRTRDFICSAQPPQK